MKSIEIGPHCVERVITGNETWVFEYDPETKCQSREWHISTKAQGEVQMHADLWIIRR